MNLADDVLAWELGPDGAWRTGAATPTAARATPTVRLQELALARHRREPSASAGERTSRREVKLGAWPGFELPDRRRRRADGLRRRARPTGDLDATYYDAADLRLVRAGHHAAPPHRRGRRRTGAWTLKLRGERPTATTACCAGRAARSTAGPGPVPAELAVARAAVAADAPTSARRPPPDRAAGRRARRRRRRRRARVGSIDDDEVSVLARAAGWPPASARSRSRSPPSAARRPARRPSSPASATPAPARPTRRPKLVRALGPRALAAARSRARPRRRRPPRPARCCGPASSSSVAAHRRARPRRSASTEQPEGIHQARVGTPAAALRPAHVRARCSTRRGPSRCATS